MAKLRIVLALSSFSSVCFASPIQGGVPARPSNVLCSIENPVLQAFAAQNSASAFCSSYISIPTKTLYATVAATTSTSTTTTIKTGTEIDTAPILTETLILSVTTTTVTSTTSDNTTPTATVAKRNLDSPKLPAALSRLAATILSSACSCLSMPAPSTTITRTATRTVSLTSTTSTFAATTTYTPVDSTTVTNIETATSTAVILKSDILASIVAIVNDNSYQPVCSDILGYTTPVTTVYQTRTTGALVTATTTSTRTNSVTLTVTSFPSAAAKRQVDDPEPEPVPDPVPDPVEPEPEPEPEPDPTPVEPEPLPSSLTTYPADYVTSACVLAITTPTTSTVSDTITITTTNTLTQTATQTVQATATATVAAVQHPVTNGNFETGTFDSWSILPGYDGDGGSTWTIQPSGDSAHGAYVAQLSMPNTGSYGSWIWQNFPTYQGRGYTMTLDYRCTQISSTAYAQVQVPGSVTPELHCADIGTWYQTSLTFTASSPSAWVYLVGEQATRVVSPAVYQFDNVVVTLSS